MKMLLQEQQKVSRGAADKQEALRNHVPGGHSSLDSASDETAAEEEAASQSEAPVAAAAQTHQSTKDEPTAAPWG